MKKKETSLHFLAQFLPDGAFDDVAVFFRENAIHLTLTHERKSVLGDYRNPAPHNPWHRISINANLNRFSFLITLLHELAHMNTFIRNGHKVSPHGAEWKEQFRSILVPFVRKKFFPAEVEQALISYISNPAASTCTDPALFRALYRYDDHQPHHKLVEELALNEHFETHEGHLYHVIDRLRTRVKCKNLHNGKVYLFPGIVEVRAIEKEEAARKIGQIAGHTRTI